MGEWRSPAAARAFFGIEEPDTRGGDDLPLRLSTIHGSVSWQTKLGEGNHLHCEATTDGTYLYMVDDGGMVTCIELATGEAKWGPERTLDGTVSASPTLADGKLFVTNEEGVTVVLRAGPEFEQLAVNELDGSYTLSTPVAVGDRLYVRTGEHLFCLAQTAAKQGAATEKDD